ncbi:MAG: MBL fold metallo-hydrolase [Alphaproteobacteria bacterium]
MECTTIYSNGEHRWLVFGRDPEKPDSLIDTNQVVVVDGDSAMLLDPGGSEIFPEMLSALTGAVSPDQVRSIFLSHQDPDIGSSLPLWRRVCREDVKIYLSWLWAGFVAHFDREADFVEIPDQGQGVSVGRRQLKLLPAHYLHSPGNFHVYDPGARILFTGDVGGALVPKGAAKDMFVHDFDRHIQYMELFHRRWFCSPAARDAWVAMVSHLEIDILVPQHGLLFRGEDVGRFLKWFGGLELGSGIEAFGQVKL